MTTVRARVGTWTIALVVFALTTAFRYLAVVRFTNDQYISLAGAQQMLFGDLPTRDFLDPGLPLSYAVSAAAQLLLGRTLFAEAVLTSVAFGIAAALTVVAARAVSGSLLLGLLAAVVEVAIFPRAYSYPKMLLYSAAPLVIWWCVRRPSLARITGLALFVQIAFLFRHDHGLFIGVGAAVAAAIAGDGMRSSSAMRRQLVAFVLISMAVALPYLIYVGVNGGLLRYFSQGVRFSAAEAAENGLVIPPFGAGEGLERNAEAFLFFLFYLLPVIAAGVLVWRWRRSGDAAIVAAIAPLVVIALLADRGFLRDELSTRLADAIVMPLLLACWLIAQIRFAASTPMRSALGVLAAAVFAASAYAVVTVGNTVEQLNRASVFGGLDRMPERFSERTAMLRDRWNASEMPAGSARVLVPFFQYVDRCTTPDQRILAPGFIPEVPVHAGRAFAGGRMTILAGYVDAPDERRAIVSTLERQNVPFMIVSSRSKPAVWQGYPELASYIESRFAPLVTYPAAENGEVFVEVRVNRTITPRGVDAATGWPCYR